MLMRFMPDSNVVRYFKQLVGNITSYANEQLVELSFKTEIKKLDVNCIPDLTFIQITRFIYKIID